MGSRDLEGFSPQHERKVDLANPRQRISGDLTIAPQELYQKVRSEQETRRSRRGAVEPGRQAQSGGTPDWGW